MDDIDISELDFLEHFGVKGMKWGVRKKQETSGESSGQAARKRRDRNKRIAGGAVAAVSVAALAYVGADFAGRLRRDKQMKDVVRNLRSMSPNKRLETGRKVATNMNLNVPKPKTFPSYSKEAASLKNYIATLERDLNLPVPSAGDLASAAKRLGI
jgi:hypothetical protein